MRLRRQPDGHRLRRGRRSRSRSSRTPARSPPSGGCEPGSRVNLEADLVGQVRREAGRGGGADTIEAAVMTIRAEYLQAYPEIDASTFATVEEAIEEIRAGRMVVVVDSPDRENEGDLVVAAEHVTADAVNFMATHARGLICLALEESRCDELGLYPMTTAQRDAARHRLHGVGRGARRGRRPASRPPTAPTRSASPSTPPPRPATSSSRGTCSRCARAATACSSGWGRPRRRSTSPGWPGCTPGRRDLRDHERGRHDGAGARPGRVLRPPRPQDDHRLRPGRLPAPHGAAGRADRDRRHAHQVRRRSRPTATGR